jgi:hypothetical protein
VGAPRLQGRSALILGERAGEGGVLPELSPTQGAIGERRKDSIDGAVQEALPFVEPLLGLPSSSGTHPVELIESVGDRALGFGGDPAGDDVGEPEAATFVPTQPIGSALESLDVLARDPPVRTDGGEGKVAAVAQIDDVLARAVEDLRRLARGE